MAPSSLEFRNTFLRVLDNPGLPQPVHQFCVRTGDALDKAPMWFELRESERSSGFKGSPDVQVM